jgi:hypothetical protein
VALADTKCSTNTTDCNSVLTGTRSCDKASDPVKKKLYRVFLLIAITKFMNCMILCCIATGDAISFMVLGFARKEKFI